VWGTTPIDPLFEKTVLVETHTPDEIPDLLAEEGLRDMWMEIVSGGGKVHLAAEKIVLVVASEQGAVLQEAQLQMLLLLHWLERVLGWDDEIDDEEADDEEEADDDETERAEPKAHAGKAAKPAVRHPATNPSTAFPPSIDITEPPTTAAPTVASVAVIGVAGLIAATLAGAVYSLLSFIIPLIYLTFLLTIALGATVGCSVSAAAKRCRLHPGLTTSVVAGLAGMVGGYVAWLVWLGLLFEFDFALWLPFDVVRIAAELSQEGVWSVFGWTPLGGALGAFWVFELLLVVASAAFTGYQGTRFDEAAGAVFTQF
jgi:hypothetical protein